MTQHHRLPRHLLVTIAACLAVACRHDPADGSGDASKAPSAVQISKCPTGPLPPSILACVQGVAITAARFAAVRPSYDAHVSNRDVLEALIDEELLVAAAQRNANMLQTQAEAQRKAAAAALLTSELEKKFTGAQIPDADIHKAYLEDAIRQHFRHAPTYAATDIELLCCTGSAEKCAESPDALACIDRIASDAANLHKLLLADPPKSSLEFSARALSLRAMYPLITVGSVNFYYDVEKSYDNQGNHFTLMVREFIDHVTPLKPGQFSGPFHTPFGWHITRVDDFNPAENRPWTDPKVRQEVADIMIDLARGRQSEKMLTELMARSKAELFADRLDASMTP